MVFNYYRNILIIVALFSLYGCNYRYQEEKTWQISIGMGYLVGEVDTNSAILQSRLTNGENLTGIKRKKERLYGRLDGHTGMGRFEISKDPNFQESFLTQWLFANSNNDFLLKTKINSLEPNTRYYYRLIYGTKNQLTYQGARGTFKTLAGKDIQAIHTITIVNCMNYDKFHNPKWKLYDPEAKHQLGYETFQTLRQLSPDYLIGTGDNVYYDQMRDNVATSLEDMRSKYHEQFSQPRLIEFFSEVGTYWLKDDHDYRRNDSDPYGDYEPSHNLGVKLFREQLPVVNPEEKEAKTYRTYRLNKNLQIWLVEGRDYRSPNNMEDGPNKTIWGEEQKKWLQDTLLTSDATFKVLITPTPMIGPDYDHKQDNHANLNGFRYERDEFFDWLLKNNLDKNFYIVSGDRHWRYHALDLVSGIEEFSVGTVDQSSNHAGNGKKPKPEDQIEHPYHQYKQTGGFLILKTIPQKDNLAPRLEFTFYHQDGKKAKSIVKKGF